MPSDYFRVKLCESAKDALRDIGRKYGKKTYETLRDLILDLEFEPDKKGEPLRGILHGLYSRHYSRFRIIYAIDKGEFLVVVVGAGYHENDSRMDIYNVIERAIDSGALVLGDEVAKYKKTPEKN
ncbi:MAG: type II toxin-antitoxin system RelE/ParE family toxin [Phycisphaerales bacterium]|nr:type II toxin-antitoxin system RelE/ParE family toxin [Phycisphaerales bacterium]